MKVNNETKVGAIALIAVIILILGFNYLKGTSLFDGTFRLYSEYENVDGLTVGSKVLINGMQIGQVNALTIDLETHKIRVDFSMSVNELKIPDDSKAMVYSVDLLGTKAINIILGKSSVYLKDEEQIADSLATSFTSQVQKELMPLKLKVEDAVSSIDSLVSNLNLLFNETNKNNLSASILNIRNTTGRLDTTMRKVDHMIASARSIVKNFEIMKILNASCRIVQNLRTHLQLKVIK
ncbi:MAG: MCE family protein [Sphingobacteriia bacterium]|nr:MCE family protein [Sphingobacteriia bacterium]